MTVLTGILVTRVLLDGARAIGVQTLNKGIQQDIAADLVIMSAGAVQSPKILMHSGIGQKEQLQKFDIPVHVDLPGVGENLHDRPIIPITAYVNGKLGYQSSAHGFGTLGAGARNLLTNDGPASGNGIESVSYWDPTDLKNEQPTVQCYHEPIIALDGLNATGSRSGVTFATVVLQPRSRGWVRLADADPTSMPLINPNFIGDDYDLKVGIEAVKAVRKVMAQQSLAEVIEEEVLPGVEKQGDEQIGEFVKSVDRLHVIDASIMPTITSGNTNAPTQALALHASKMLVSNYF